MKPPTPTQTSNVAVNAGFDAQGDGGDDATRRGSNSDDDENMTPAQSRRKAQNRAAYVFHLSYYTIYLSTNF